ncbi:hypothetical protein OBBRIDRAFT_836268 [Obba rivulosa]|uniref:Uncharacterized protein n=1 Tax=Obba rivulosa TaxID=1052685 RepID=A0A8E2AY87_9APHY|nr:hypothetical protein OBBRIDRAFT_836268 [Obba rivulosa]
MEHAGAQESVLGPSTRGSRAAPPSLLPMLNFSLGSVHLPPTPTFPKFTLRRRWVSAGLVGMGVLLFGLVLWEGTWVPRWADEAVVLAEKPQPAPLSNATDAAGDGALFQDLYGTEYSHLRPVHYLADPPTANFRDALRNDTKYLTSFLSAGFTNDVMTIANMVFLAMVTSRVPIIPPFTSHINAVADPLTFSDIFDVPRLARALNAPILEWADVKDLAAAEAQRESGQDEVGCWNIWEVDNVFAEGPRGSFTARVLNLDISYTRAPASVKLIPDFEHDSHSSFWALARLDAPNASAEILADPVAHPTRLTEQGHALPPDEQLLCYDYVYYLCASEPFEYELDHYPAWNFVLRHFHWTSDLEQLGKTYLRRTFQLLDDAPIPPFIAIHARRGDFANWCGEASRDTCFPPLSTFNHCVDEIRAELLGTRGIASDTPIPVVLTSDERDETWWGAVAEVGWLRVDHARERTVERYGAFYPVVLDAVVQSFATGFVGTERSTFSTLARRRVTDWNRGVVRMAKWGAG